VTVFIGGSGTGKSVIVKLYATLAWLEKSLYLGRITKEELGDTNFLYKQLSYQRVSNCLKDKSLVKYSSVLGVWEYFEELMTESNGFQSDMYKKVL